MATSEDSKTYTDSLPREEDDAQPLEDVTIAHESTQLLTNE